ncbi:phosphonate C-P lyase system protein PhnG [Paracoccus shanxieyensis]|uniref:Phosphonate C-P lyase system protein PhnG n=1 Tax=Paracoccus shanxieyensis TaxID=2675752 RepID=A0A6L6J0X5_9RHOB|nr:phosphonate C-P lyase system protein PhnG [Paracoccus shanxieyensis]MTH65551.1 phosphonate C-P lyase system protein PhnG [Paracoccus shanxieyensis]MTH88653.1 phosphonate C-P lyase system protein PhnG [Paracoccus shanxieyensis]
MSASLSPADRRDALGLLARAPAARLAELLPDLPAHETLRAPEIGTVMVQGRAGGTGAAFNLGEITVTRASVRLASGQVGHGYVQGRDKGHALRAALIDAAGRPDIIATLRAEENARRARIAAEAAATRVEFFTLARGEDE